MFNPILWKTKLSIIIIAILLLIFIILRLILAKFLNISFFGDLSSSDILTALINGIRFDLSTLSYVIFPFLFLVFLPINSIKYIKTLYTISIILSFSLILYYIGDIIFFSMFNKHITSEILASTGSLSFLIKFALTQYFLVILLILSLVSLSILLTNKYINANYTKYNFNKKNNIITSLCLLMFIFVTIICMRGSIYFNNRPIRVTDAYNESNEKVALLTLVGIYPAYENILKFKRINMVAPPLYIV